MPYGAITSSNDLSGNGRWRMSPRINLTRDASRARRTFMRPRASIDADRSMPMTVRTGLRDGNRDAAGAAA